jgi:hypothetical protein
VTEIINRRLSRCLRAMATAMVASANIATPLAHGWPAERAIVVPPGALPELARQPGQAMFLHESDDGRALLYVEQSQGAQLAIFDVTNPARIKSGGVVQLDVPGPFDFVASLGNRAEVVHFRDGTGDAVLDLNNANAPALRTAARPSLQVNGPPVLDYQMLESPDLVEFNGLLHAREITGQLTKRDTGTTFLLTQSGIYVIRHPMAERAKDRRDDARQLMYSGG